jgi:hypothetical protein
MSEPIWRVLDGEGNEQGPYSAEDLQGYYASGNINHETMVWTVGLEQWVPAGQIEGLLPVLPQVVELVPAPVVQIAPVAAPVPAAPAPGAGINLSPQIAGITPGAVGPLQKTPTSGWISILTILIGVTSFFLFFFPWVSMSMNISDSTEVKMIKAVTQSGMQAITQNQTVDEKFLEVYAKESGVPTEDLKKEIAEAEENPLSGSNYKASFLVMGAMIAVGLGTVLAMIGFVNKSGGPIIFAQFIYIVAALFIGIQMAKQFPMVTAIVSNKEKAITEAKKSLEEAYEALAQIDPEKAAKEKNKDLQSLNDDSALRSNFEPACFATVGFLGVSLLLVVITMSTGSSPTIVQPVATGQPVQPGGIRFQ